MSEFLNPYLEPRKKSPGEVEVVAGQYLVTIFRALGVPMPYKADAEAVARTGMLVQRWWRRLSK